MAIILRTDSGSALSYAQVDANFTSMFYSASQSGNTMTFFRTGSNGLGIPSTSSSFSLVADTLWTASGATIQRIGNVLVSGSFTNGLSCTVSGLFSHAQGQSTQATGTGSHAEGYFAGASGRYSHAEGSTTVASGIYSHAEGVTTTASGTGSHAEGVNSVASGNNSHAEGDGTQQQDKALMQKEVIHKLTEHTHTQRVKVISQ